jgi:hypothetical protein
MRVEVDLDDERAYEINKQEFYMAIVDRDFFVNPIAVVEFIYAQELLKPTVIALKEGVNLPMEFMTENIVHIEYWNSNESSIKECFEKLLGAYNEWKRANEGKAKDIE